MRSLTGILIALFFTTSLFAQFRGIVNPATPTVQGSFGNVVFPAGTSASSGVTRTFPNAVFPGGGGPRLNVPFSSQDPTRLSGNFGPPNPNRGFVGGGFVGGGSVNKGFVGGFNNGFAGRRSRTTIISVPYLVPVYGGGYGYGYGPGAGYYDNGYPPDQAPPSQPNIVVVYPPQAPAVVGAPGPVPYAALPPTQEGPPEQTTPAAATTDQSTTEASHFLIAFKDHTVYSAVAYWVEGDTLHYFTTPSTHNQVSLSLIDKDLTQRLNREAGINMQLPK